MKLLLSLGVCSIFSVSGIAQTAPTFTKDIAPLFYKNCASCHRPGEMAPMSLLTYEQVRPWAKSIREKVSLGIMPPWHSEAPRGTFSNDRRLTDAEKSLISKWVDAGSPKGNEKDLPAMPKFAEGWDIGKPDVVVTMAQPFEVPAKGTIPYQNITIPTNFTEDKWVQAIEVRPGVRQVVHHILVFEKDPAGPTQRDAFRLVVPQMPARPPRPEGSAPPVDKGPGNLIALEGPGTNPMVFEPGQAIRIPAGAVLTLQIHYTANGKMAVADSSSVGMIFAKTPPKEEMRASAFYNPRLVLAAGAANEAVPSAIQFTEDSHISALCPHTHLRGKNWDYKAVYPDGKTVDVLPVPNYDFNWQTCYVFAQPLAMPKGSRLEALAHYDNSTSNKSNPDPTVEVHWGEQTWEEMQYTGINYSVDAKPAAATSSPGQ